MRIPANFWADGIVPYPPLIQQDVMIWSRRD